ncbi:hypothetical protein PISMIDRAFT_680516 [Pisolithus microcarpus 441]|uniref:Uncharacterized protein n=1 Tax=Pisolithus microcarpus 441 TaxID=765257 RepID=A0A0C9YZJ0_9AGAM|nr:hypothetical protein PISMIDRAFT_680516 [Pisolithus microcarpus 441]
MLTNCLSIAPLSPTAANSWAGLEASIMMSHYSLRRYWPIYLPNFLWKSTCTLLSDHHMKFQNTRKDRMTF